MAGTLGAGARHKTGPLAAAPPLARSETRLKPILWRWAETPLGEVTFPAYFTLLTLGFCCTIYLSRREAERVGIDPVRMVDLHLFMILFGMIGSRLLHVIADGHLADYVHLCTNPVLVPAIDAPVAHCTLDSQCGDYYRCAVDFGRCHPPRDCLAWIKFWRGGLTYYGGFLGATAFGLYYMRRHRMPLWKTCDIAGRLIPLGLCWGRLGCFFNGCCFGAPVAADHPLGARFPKYGPAWRAQLDAKLIGAADSPLPVHPTQLYEALACVIIFAYLMFVQRPRQRFDGQAWWSFVVLYAGARFAIEVLRRDERGGLWLLSTSQLISLPLFVLGLVMLHRLWRRAAAGSTT